MSSVSHRSGWVGWIYFAGIMMVIAGALGMINGFMAIVDPHWVIYNADGALWLNLSGWGWLHLLIGLVILASGIGVFSGNVAARTVGVIAAGISIIANFIYLPAYPFWSIIVIVLDALVIWALTVHGDEARDG